MEPDSDRPGSDAPPEGALSTNSRRVFVQQMTGTMAAVSLGPAMLGALTPAAGSPVLAGSSDDLVDLRLRINGQEVSYRCDPRLTLLDLLRERLDLTGTKKGCDHGQCGACTVLVNGRRINSCLALAVAHDGDEVTTIEGLAQNGKLHPVQSAFHEHDGFQCGYCTPGQICSAVALLKEGHAGSDAEIKEWMSGNLCRCGAYVNIVAAIKAARAAMAT